MTDLTGNIIVIVSILLIAPFMFSKRLSHSQLWQATVTPLASIIGSGFLIAAPLVVLTTGRWAIVSMLGIVTVAYFLGSVMRFNIVYLEPYLERENKSKIIIPLEKFSQPTLGIAYMISVAFYLKLLSVFALSGLSVQSNIFENVITTVLLLFIGFLGWFKGLHTLEILEKYAVTLKLIIIGALIVGFFSFNILELIQGEWAFFEHNHNTFFGAFQSLLGVLIIVQGFETSRYLGGLYSPEIRIKSMKYSQIISGVIYVVFISSAMILFNDIHTISETVIIDLCKIVAPILPFLLIIAAIMSQFSAAVSDTIGSSGLISEASHKVVSVGRGIVITVSIAISLIWLTDIYEIIVIASKAFAIYYAMQCLIAARLAFNQKDTMKLYCFLALFILMLMVIFLGIPAA